MEVIFNIEDWFPSQGKDAGLDLVCDQPFLDGRGGHPLYFFQCASGRSWEDKIETPDLRLWAKFFDFSSDPVRGFAIPYVLSSKKKFRSVNNRVDGLLLDRLRLIAPLATDGDQVPSDLESSLIDWLTPRIEGLRSE